VTSSLVRRPDIFCWVLRADSPLAEVVRWPEAGIGRESEHVGLPGLAELEELAAGLLAGLVLRAWDAGDGGQADGLAVARRRGPLRVARAPASKRLVRRRHVTSPLASARNPNSRVKGRNIRYI
jgi:hypothetical protein